jgi:hypothetical protein
MTTGGDALTTTSASELTGSERAALITVRLYSGASLSNRDVAHICGYSDRTGAFELMQRLARVLPVYFDQTERPGRWTLLDGAGAP